MKPMTKGLLVAFLVAAGWKGNDLAGAWNAHAAEQKEANAIIEELGLRDVMPEGAPVERLGLDQLQYLRDAGIEVSADWTPANPGMQSYFSEDKDGRIGIGVSAALPPEQQVDVLRNAVLQLQAVTPEPRRVVDAAKALASLPREP